MESYPTYGPTYPASQKGLPGTKRNSLHITGITPKPPYSTNPRTAKQKAITKKMDARREPLR
jgi:hypothetical protein